MSFVLNHQDEKSLSLKDFCRKYNMTYIGRAVCRSTNTCIGTVVKMGKSFFKVTNYCTYSGNGKKITSVKFCQIRFGDEKYLLVKDCAILINIWLSTKEAPTLFAFLEDEIENAKKLIENPDISDMEISFKGEKISKQNFIEKFLPANS